MFLNFFWIAACPASLPCKADGSGSGSGSETVKKKEAEASCVLVPVSF